MTYKPKNLMQHKIEIIYPDKYTRAELKLLAELIYEEVMRERRVERINRSRSQQRANRPRPALSLVKPSEPSQPPCSDQMPASHHDLPDRKTCAGQYLDETPPL